MQQFILQLLRIITKLESSTHLITGIYIFDMLMSTIPKLQYYDM